MAARNLNRILATVVITSAAVSLTPTPTFAYITHPATFAGSVNFDGDQKIRPMRYFTYHRTQKVNPAEDSYPGGWDSQESRSPSHFESNLDSEDAEIKLKKLLESYSKPKVYFGQKHKPPTFEDVHSGKGPVIPDQYHNSLRVKFQYHRHEFDDKSKEYVVRGSSTKHVCFYGKPDDELMFKEKMKGMREGGRRIIVLFDQNGRAPPKIYDVNLLQVSSFALRCWFFNCVP